MKNKMDIDVSGMQLTIHTDYDRAYVDMLAKGLTTRIEEIQAQSAGISKLDASLLLLLDMLDTSKQLAEENAKIKSELERAKLDLEIKTIENEKLKKKKD